MERRVNYSVVVPVYNSSGSLGLLFKRLDDFFRRQGFPYELILVNDKSPDRSLGVIKNLAAKNRSVKYISLAKNSGQQVALFAGIINTTGDFVITMDDDLQHPPEEIAKLIKKINQSDAEVVYGQYKNKQHTMMKNLTSAVANNLIKKITGTKYTVTSFRIMKRSVAKRMSSYRGGALSTSGIISHCASKIEICLVDHDKRAAGKSNYSFSRLAKFFLVQILSHTHAPIFWPIYFAPVAITTTILMILFQLAGYFFLPDYFSTVLLVAAAIFALIIVVQLSLTALAAAYIQPILKAADGLPRFFIEESNIKDAREI